MITWAWSFRKTLIFAHLLSLLSILSLFAIFLGIRHYRLELLLLGSFFLTRHSGNSTAAPQKDEPRNSTRQERPDTLADGVATSLAPGEDPEPDAWAAWGGWLVGWGYGRPIGTSIFPNTLQDDIYIYNYIDWLNSTVSSMVQNQPSWLKSHGPTSRLRRWCTTCPLALRGHSAARLAGNLLFSWMIIYIKNNYKHILPSQNMLWIKWNYL